MAVVLRQAAFWALGLLLLAAAPGRAQQLDVWLDAGAAHVRSPAGVDRGTYGLLGLRFDVAARPPFSLAGSVRGGRATGPSDDTWIGGTATGEVSRQLGRVRVGAALELFGLQYTQPFRYGTFGAAAVPRIRVPFGGVVLSAAGELRRGGWRSTVTAPTNSPGPPGGPPFDPGANDPQTARADGDLSVTGGELSIGRALGPAWLELTAEHRQATNGVASGAYGGIGADVIFSRDRVDVLAGGTWWQAPDTSGAGRMTELAYHAGLRVRVDERLATHANLGRSVSSPRYGSRGTFAASVGVSWRVGGAESRARLPIVEVGDRASSGRRVRFRFRHGDAERVALAGDFNDWTPVPMTREGDLWTLERTLASGFHHFAFVVDGEHWVVPNDAPGIVEDGWGRRNASIVVEK